MKSKQISLLFILTMLLTACGPRKLSPELQIRQAVAGTLSAIPTPTRVALPTIYPTATAFSLEGLFCEYQFCIGHPRDMAFFDVNAQRNPGSPSTYVQGNLVAYNANLFIQVLWQTAPGASDPQILIDLILDDQVDTYSGQTMPRLVGDIYTLFSPIATTATPVLPFGGVGAWTCGDRVFAWKAYAPDTGSAESLFNDALNRFACRK